MERARGCWRHLRTMFQELEECRAFELLKVCPPPEKHPLEITGLLQWDPITVLHTFLLHSMQICPTMLRLQQWCIICASIFQMSDQRYTP